MKKSLLSVLIAIVAVTSVFAGAINSFQGPVNSQSATAQVSFDLKPADIAFYRFGFTKDQLDGIVRPNLGYEPTPLGNIELKISEDKKSASASGEMYIYYYMQCETLPTLTLKAGNGLERDSYDGVIAYDITVAGRPSLVEKSGSASGTKLPLAQLNGGVTAGAFQFSIKTTTDFTPEMASNAETFKDTITLTISQS